MKNYIKRLLRESLMSEEYSTNGELYGYHVTSLKNLNSIENGGLTVGHRAMQGHGLYAFYDYDHAVIYGNKGEITDPIIVKFQIKHPDRFLILNMDIAKQIFGDEYHLINQIVNYFYVGLESGLESGLERFYNEYVKLANPSMSIEQLKDKLNDIEVNNDEMNQRTFVFNLIPKTLNDTLNIIWNGEYGLEFRINNLRYITVSGYENLEGGVYNQFSISNKIPKTKEFEPLKEFLKNYSELELDTVVKAYNFAEKKYYDSRNQRDWGYYENIMDLLDKLK